MARKCSDDDDDSWSDDDDDDDDLSDGQDAEAPLLYYPLCCPTPASKRTDVADGAQQSQPPLLAFPTLSEALHHDQTEFKFDLLGFLPSADDNDFYESAIVVINMCRSHVAKVHNANEITQGEDDVGRKLKEFISSKQLGTARDDDNDDDEGGMEEYYRPVLADDAVLMSLDDLEDLKRRYEEEEKEEGRGIKGKDESGTSCAKEEEGATTAALVLLRERVSALEGQLARAKSCIAALTKEEDDDDDDDKQTTKKKKPSQDNDTYYFTSYSSHYIHETMLKDTVRTQSYQRAILSNAETLFKDKIVLDVGCGTCVLSIFAARAGAKKVIAVDGSDIIEEARLIVETNGFGDIITCVGGMLEELMIEGESSGQGSLPGLEPGEKVDVIVSEWMGYGLFFETMLPSVMKARDSIMVNPKEGGTMYPNATTIYLEGASDPRLSFWENVYGIDMSAMKGRVSRELRSQAGVEIVDADEIETNRAALIGYDLNTCRDDELDFTVPFELRPNDRAAKAKAARIDKLVVSFDIDFNVPNTNAVSFSTGCQTQPTHWKQAVLWFNLMEKREGGGTGGEGGALTLDDGEVMRGKFSMARNEKNHRDIDFVVVWEVGRGGDSGSGDFVRRCDGVIVTTLGA